ncbi:MAG: STAS domain-containing protein [Methylomonas sp.]
MAEKNEGSLIGYEPLAWMHQQAGEQQLSTASPDDDTEGFSTSEVDAGETSTETIEDAGDWQNHELDAPADSAPACGVIALEPVLTINNAAQWHQRFLDALDNNDKIEIDASAVTMVDTSTLQLLLILKRTAIELQKQVVIDFPSDKFVEAAKLLGISQILEVDSAAAGFF